MLGVQLPLLIVQRSIYVPYASAVKVELPVVGKLNVPVPPLTMLHAPVPTDGVLPPKEVDINVPHKFCVLPTVAVVGIASTVTAILAAALQQSVVLS